MPELTNNQTPEKGPRKYSLNLSPRYAANWTAWEVAREFVCNAIDAAEDGMKIGGDGADYLTVETPTHPNFAELFMIGEGTKTAGGETIGQFGEGAKIAALVVTRVTGASITIHVPGHTIRFGFEEIMGSQCLHAYVDPSDVEREGCLVELRMPGVGRATFGRILSDRTGGPLGKSADGSCRVFSKGVWIQDMRTSAIYDWNLNTLTINRDRGMADPLSVIFAVSSWLDSNITPEIAESVVKSLKSIESEAILYCIAQVNRFLGDAFRRLHGPKAVIASEDPECNRKARAEGYEPHMLHKEVAKRCALAGVQYAEQVLPRDHMFDSVDTAPYADQIASLRRFDKPISAPSLTVCVFGGASATRMGYANLEDNRIWLNERLFGEGQEFELVRTYLHEMAHFIGQATDATKEFENALDLMLATFAMIAVPQAVPA